MDTEGEMVSRAGIIAPVGIGLIEGGLKDDVVGMPQGPGHQVALSYPATHPAPLNVRRTGQSPGRAQRR